MALRARCACSSGLRMGRIPFLRANVLAASAGMLLLLVHSFQVLQTLNGFLLRGDAGTAAEAEQAAAIARGYLLPSQKLENRLNVVSGIQVSLRVRIVEMSRAVTRELGVNWQALG